MTIYGIRHHGPGCARSLLEALSKSSHDLILLESPTESEVLFEHAGTEGMKPPVAMLLYQTDEPENSAFYPFARYSPEWQTLLWAKENDIPVRAFDLPAAHSFALHTEEAPSSADDDDSETEEISEEESLPREDPFNWFARADGYSDGERWWNDKVEERESSSNFFAAILEAVTALREELDLPETRRTLLREAWMRRGMRQAAKDGFQDIAVVCGAWHAPALATKVPVRQDNQLLKGLAKVKISATWSPWTNERLTLRSGYGAGVRAPGWYDHLWAGKKFPTARWITRAARVLRENDLEGSSASIIEATRLADSLAGLRGRPRPGLDESLEAIRTVFCAGEQLPLSLLEEPLLVGKSLGTLPDGLSDVPLQKDIEATQKRLRLKPTAAVKEVTFDLREERGREKSAFLHRLLILKIKWGKTLRARSKGTFKEVWRLHWKPELVLSIIDASSFGNTVETAASSCLAQIPADSTLREISQALDLSLLSVLPQATEVLLRQLDNRAATSHDTRELLNSVPTLVNIARYGDVRDTDATHVLRILSQLTTRAHIELVSSTTGLDSEAAGEMTVILRSYHQAVQTLGDEEILTDFHQAALRLARAETASPQPRGFATRLLRDAQIIEMEESTRLLHRALSQGQAPEDSATWLEGFLAGSGTLLVHDRPLLALIHQWLGGLSDDHFQNILPLLRRTFGAFTSPEKSRIAQTLEHENLTNPQTSPADTWDIDPDRAAPVIARAEELLSLT
ncbi:DUF5682 family protein [Roseibacillus ishigakijimensis]|uniref:Uncharacterized protein n=1 Tax=Roseibacillus ishigakijimensis TaxID=454146 RepID=A0A934RR39_9BACT|nr:DUF5682 family protein [Roseibacillus ishigakijimensis]MBK1833514.1 hypothetical protein [Roseibacillus ishigakijimensis]